MDSKITKLLTETRKVPHSGKQRCFRLSVELDLELTEIAQAAQSLLGYNVSVSHISRMILSKYATEVKDLLVGHVEDITSVISEFAPDIPEDDEDLDDTEDAVSVSTKEDRDSEEEYVRRLLDASAIDTSSTWEP
jgi:hypothetical protein